jgi:hypothetical protein
MVGRGDLWDGEYLLVHLTRSDHISYDRISIAEMMVPILDHKKNQRYPENTIQRTTQNLRDGGNIDFAGHGRYRMTGSRLSMLISVRATINLGFQPHMADQFPAQADPYEPLQRT